MKTAKNLFLLVMVVAALLLAALLISKTFDTGVLAGTFSLLTYCLWGLLFWHFEGIKNIPFIKTIDSSFWWVPCIAFAHIITPACFAYGFHAILFKEIIGLKYLFYGLMLCIYSFYFYVMTFGLTKSREKRMSQKELLEKYAKEIEKKLF